MAGQTYFQGMDHSDPSSSMTKSPARQKTFNAPAIGVTLICSLAFAAWLYAHLGDFTAERGMRAGLQVAAISLAFGAMAHLIVEAVTRAVLGLQNELDTLAEGRARRRGSDDES